MSKTFSLKRVQLIPSNLEKVWDFFSDPLNLPLITPPEMKIRIISENENQKIYPGQIIEYKVTPLPFYTSHWVTEITLVEPHKMFIDEQRSGPYSLWQHQHIFQESDEGVKMVDIIHYKIPLGYLGTLANSLLVRKKIEHIFEYRAKIINELFHINDRINTKKNEPLKGSFKKIFKR